MRRLLLAADVVGLSVAYLVALGLSSPPASADRIAPIWEFALFVATLPLWVLLARVYGLYDRDEERSDHSTVDDVVGVFQVVTLGTWSFLVITHVLGAPYPNLGRLVVFWLLAVALIPLLRAVSRAIGRRQAAYIQNVIIVGSGQVARLLADKIEKHPEYGLRCVGFVDKDDRVVGSGNGKTHLIGTTEDLPRLVHEHAVHRVAVAFSTDSHDQTLGVIRSMQGSDVQIDIVPRMFEVLGANVQLHTIEGLPLLGLSSPRLSGSSRFLKRSLDLVAAALGLMLLAPMFVVVAVAIKTDSRGPVFFRQVRMGERGRPFLIWKFRTMRPDADARKAEVAHLNMHVDHQPMFKAPHDPRVTRVGEFLRRWSLDELPQLFNVLQGEMSLVGPRPLILDEDEHVHDWARRRLDLKPGITGLWQAMGASEIPFEEMVHLDYLYVTGWSPLTDLKLALRTIPAVLRERHAY